MEPVDQSKNFYEAVEQIMRRVRKQVIDFPDQTLIPNKLKTNLVKRAFRIQETHPHSSFILNQIQLNPAPLRLHIVRGRAVVQLENKKTKELQMLTLRENTSFQIPVQLLEILKINVKTLDRPVLLAVEIFHEAETKIILNVPIPENRSEFIKYRESFLNQELTQEEIRQNLIFLDAEFARTPEGKFIPVSVAMLDYKGSTLMDTVVCPRQQIRNYETRCHGLAEEDVIGKEDSEEVIRRVQELVRDKILVGNDLQLDIKALRIDVGTVTGIRDLSNSKAIRRRIENPHPTIGLKEIAKKLLNLDIQQGPHSAMEDTRTVRETYLAVEEDWEDHFVKKTRNTLTTLDMWPNPLSQEEMEVELCEIEDFDEPEDTETEMEVQVKCSNYDVAEVNVEDKEVKFKAEVTIRIKDGKRIISVVEM